MTLTLKRADQLVIGDWILRTRTATDAILAFRVTGWRYMDDGFVDVTLLDNGEHRLCAYLCADLVPVVEIEG